MITGEPERASLIPPSIDSLIVDYQSPLALPGHYPNEDGPSVGPRRHLSQAATQETTGIGKLLIYPFQNP